MAKITVDGKEYALAMTIYATGQIEDQYGDLKTAMSKFRVSNNIKMVKDMFRILANAQLAYEGKEETVTGDELKRLKVAALHGLSAAIQAAVEEGMKSETTGGEEADDEVFDVYLNEIESKN
jgi:hypothetical protein